MYIFTGIRIRDNKGDWTVSGRTLNMSQFYDEHVLNVTKYKQSNYFRRQATP